MSARALMDAQMTEKEFQADVVELARRLGWLVYHTYDARRSEPGFPDLVLCRPETDRFPGQLLYAELKSERGTVSAAQVRWLRALRSARVEVVVWRPSDWTVLEARLRRKHSLPLADDAPPVSEQAS